MDEPTVHQSAGGSLSPAVARSQYGGDGFYLSWRRRRAPARMDKATLRRRSRDAL